MTTEGHIAALERRHQELDRMIQTESQNRLADDLTVSALKRKKLEVKDELFKLQSATRQ
ncbi:YdcH family protein [Devosia sp. Naph2]|uniref:YdcH family protein n=1 Tax=Devosia polycyclovorans TaxID=3345148 RepID=UPI0035D12603